jgi:hypothetical protein
MRDPARGRDRQRFAHHEIASMRAMPDEVDLDYRAVDAD